MSQLALIGRPAQKLHTLTFAVHGEPIPCGRPRSSIGRKSDGSAFVRVYADPKSDQYEKLIGDVARGAASHVRGWRRDWAAYELRVRVYRSERRGDGDNFAKAVADGCNKVLWDDDGRVVSWHVNLLDEFDKPRVEVLVAMVGALSAEDDRRARARLQAARRRAL